VKLTIVAAVSDNGVIGRDGTLPWHLPDDLRRFKSLTVGRPILMGRRTFDAIGRPLPARSNLVLTRNPRSLPAGVFGVSSVEQAIEQSSGAAELCVIGGAEVYKQTLPRTDRLEMTLVHAIVDGDVNFPDYQAEQWREVERIEHPADDRHVYAMTFLTLDRV
jgi:dihydrofolate reductase